MRVRRLYLRLLAVLLAVLWGAAAALLLVGYRPGGRFDPLVAAAPLIGMAVAAATAIWPPLARGSRIATLVGWLGVVSVLLVVPTLGSALDAFGQRNPAPLLPSFETAYAWVLALAATGLFGGLGTAGRILGAAASRRARLTLGLAISVAVTTAGLGFSGIAVLENALVFESGGQASLAVAASGWGPVDPALAPPACTGTLRAGPGARVTVDASAKADGRVAGTVSLKGRRSGHDASWQATITRVPAPDTGGPSGTRSSSAPAVVSSTPRAETSAAPGTRSSNAPAAVGAARTSDLSYVTVGGKAWLRVDGGAWQPVTPPVVAAASSPQESGMAAGALDQAVVVAALTAGSRLAAEDLGIETFGGAPARHCRLAVDGPTALAAFRPLRWLIGQAPLATVPALQEWRGELDWWVFGDGELGMARVSIGGQPPPAWGGLLQGTLTATLTARDRTAGAPIVAPGG